MGPIEELSNNLMALLEDISGKKDELDTRGQKVLLDSLRKLLIATQQLNMQIQTLTKLASCPQPAKPALYLVK
jgi:hypothetical protein